ncbi:MAG: phosphoribosylaminoimidazolesuccinocarboxamide synthase [Candidatus Ancillula sp.]|jgi:phosphoribosylaminoimidazole-succinocarboxamide synthase|nr:phosphoribosylaminoimidazolesuccinocarboxamide synthase [Candidatus Ancillula sp.]
MYSDLSAWKHLASGKVRELYVPKGEHPLGDVVLVVATDRISAFDHVLEPSIPGKGVVLTQMSILWFEYLKEHLDIPHHFITATSVPVEVAGRAIICKRLNMLPVECVARGYLTGSAYQEYASTGKYQEFTFAPGMKDGQKLDHPIFTPAAKAEVGEHDENITFQKMSDTIGAEVATESREKTLAVFEVASTLSERAGMTLVDTKFEFGFDPQDNTITLGDEVLTPDSSRFWDENKQSVDKQFVRNYLLRESGWDPKSNQTPPELPEEVVDKTVQLYKKVLKNLKGAL